MTRSAFRQTFVTAHGSWDSPLGRVIVAASSSGLCGVWFEGQRYAPQGSDWIRNEADPVLGRAISQLVEFFAGRRTEFDLPLDLTTGTPFQRSVWGALRDIPKGITVTYGQIACRLGQPRAVRAAAAAVGRNPLSIVVPCHRVIGADGSLTGYAGGIERKAALLALEGAR